MPLSPSHRFPLALVSFYPRSQVNLLPPDDLLWSGRDRKLFLDIGFLEPFNQAYLIAVIIWIPLGKFDMVRIIHYSDDVPDLELTHNLRHPDRQEAASFEYPPPRPLVHENLPLDRGPVGYPPFQSGYLGIWLEIRSNLLSIQDIQNHVFSPAVSHDDWNAALRRDFGGPYLALYSASTRPALLPAHRPAELWGYSFDGFDYRGSGDSRVRRVQAVHV